MIASNSTRATCWRACAAAVAILLSSRPALGQAAVRLSEGMSLEAEIARGEIRKYEADLPANFYFAVTLHDANCLVATVVAPDGSLVYQYPAAWGPHPVAIIASTAGIYRLEVRILQPGPLSSAAQNGGKQWKSSFRLQVDAIRPPSRDDETRARIAQLLSETDAIFETRGPGWWERGGALAAQALEDARGLDDRLAEARTLYLLAGFAPDSANRVDFTRREVAVRHAMGEEYGEAMALLILSDGLLSTGDLDASRESLERALAMLRAAGRRPNEADALGAVSTLNVATGDLDAALERAYEALALARALNDPVRESSALLAVGLVYLRLGEVEAGIDALNRMAALSPDAAAQQTSRFNIASALMFMGQDSAAEDLFQNGLSWCRTSARCPSETSFLLALAELHARRSDLNGARALFEQVVSIASKAHAVSAERAARLRLADVFLRAGELDAADRELGAASGSRGEDPIDADTPAILLIRARLSLARHDLKAAQTQAEEAVRLTESVRARAESTRVRSSVLAATQGAYATLVRVLMDKHDAEPTAGHDARALEIYERARARSLLETLTAPPVPATSGGSSGVDDLRRLQRRISAKAAAADVARQMKDEKLVASLTRELDELTHQFTLAELRFRRDDPAAASVAAPEPLSVEAIRRDVLDPDTVLVEYMLGEPDSYAWVVAERSVASYRLPGKSVVEAAARAFVQQIAAPTPRAQRVRLDKVAGELGQLLLSPLAAVPRGKRLLLVVPGILQQVPFAALRVPGSGEFLVARHEILHAPSASIVAAARIRDARRPPAPNAVAVFADPVYEPNDPRVTNRHDARADGAAGPPSLVNRALRAAGDHGGLPRLPFTRQEADIIAALAPAGTVDKATDFAATRRRATDPSLASYGIVHFATHALLNTRTPELSGLVLSLVDEEGRAQDGFVRLTDISRMRLNADLAVLSGCETALGRAIAGEGTIGLTRGFVVAGARRVVANLWKVDDLATSELMREFYTEVLVRHRPPAAALRTAQRRLAASSRWRDPYYWAGVVFQGEWRGPAAR